MLKITHRCRRRGTLGVSYAPDGQIYDVNVTGPDKGIYRTAEPCPFSEMDICEVHYNYGSAGCEWESYAIPRKPTLDPAEIASRWIEDRQAERDLAFLELHIEATRQSFCTDGN